MVADLSLGAEEVPFGSAVLPYGIKVKGHHVFGREPEDLIAVIGSEIGFGFVEVHGIRLHEINGQVWRGVLAASIALLQRFWRGCIHTEENIGRVVSEVERIDVKRPS